jgi:hypothetical protein
MVGMVYSGRLEQRIGMIKEVVGSKMYNVWLDMLKRLVPGGRTHRLAVVVAGMLQYTLIISHEKEETNAKAKTMSDLFDSVFEFYNDGDLEPAIELVEKLFIDAGVNYARVNSRGDSYSIAEEAVHEFLAWENMPWER